MGIIGFFSSPGNAMPVIPAKGKNLLRKIFSLVDGMLPLQSQIYFAEVANSNKLK